MASYGSSYTPRRMNTSKCIQCPPPAIITDSNNNNISDNTFIKIKKLQCAYVIKNRLSGAKNPFSTLGNQCIQLPPGKVTAFGGLYGTPGGSGKRLTNKF